MNYGREVNLPPNSWSEVSFSVSLLNGNQEIWSHVSNWFHPKAWKCFDGLQPSSELLKKLSTNENPLRYTPPASHGSCFFFLDGTTEESEFRVRWDELSPKINTDFSCIMAKCCFSYQLSWSMSFCDSNRSWIISLCLVSLLLLGFAFPCTTSKGSF